ncbi:unnamed protein product [Spirodela intermedia]|uniref:Pectinesterase n=1 Tax=Spirodela intermedia TaxID=51605 RepID=A0A7I8I9F9_SPIIN|nr:unnamed protein product [Spirodela intermedia]CAA6654336.1 unnamed protein product [Spirodela intermedia]
MPRPKGKTDAFLRCSSLFLLLSLLISSAHAGEAETHLQAARLHCDGTLYPSLCVSTLNGIRGLTSKNLPQIISAAVSLTIGEVYSSSSNCSGILRQRTAALSGPQRIALNDCLELLDQTAVFLRDTVSGLSSTGNASRRVDDLRTLLSASIANQYTCLDGFINDSSGKSSPFRSTIESRIGHLSRSVSNALALVGKISSNGAVNRDSFPSWLTRKDRGLLQAPVSGIKPNLTVAKDGSGNFTTISAAVAAAPSNSNTRFVIYIKAGGYFENVDVDSKKTNLMFIGDGMGKTVVKASRNVVDGWTTFRSATVGDGGGNRFIARDMTFENAAGPSKEQAVALRSGSDLSAFYRCSFVGYQDTLYVHSLRQFYRQCDIYGTIDFIFGDAAVTRPNENTGISIQGCKVAAAADLIPVKSSFKSYLGRPWRQYSRTVYINSFMENIIDPAGWLPWSGNFALSTLYYGEYRNRGPGSNTTRRVTWPGYRVIKSSTEANQFTVRSFIQGDQWLGPTGIPSSLASDRPDHPPASTVLPPFNKMIPTVAHRSSLSLSLVQGDCGLIWSVPVFNGPGSRLPDNLGTQGHARPLPYAAVFRDLLTAT